MKKTFLILGLLFLSLNLRLNAQSDGVERLEVTGSHIKKIDVEGASPIQVLDRDFLDNSGYNSISDVLRDLTASAFGGIRETAGSNAAGVSSVNLRGLGSDRTLILLDGKRLPTDPIAGVVDLNLIPMGAVQRIDILKDGASATYGSDALGGVINIITRKDFVGSQVNIRTSVNRFEGGERTDGSLLHGYATNKFRILGVGNFRTNKKIKSSDRPWTKDVPSTFTIPANRRPVNVDGIGNVIASGPRTNHTGGPDLNNFNPFAYSDAVPSIDQYSALIQGDYKISPDITAYARIIGNMNKIKWQYAPNAATYNATGGLLPPVTGGFAQWQISDRMVEMGNRISNTETKSYGGQLGAKGYFFDTWSWETTYDYNKLDREVTNPNGYSLVDKMAALIASGGYNPFAAPGSRIINFAGYEDIKTQPWNRSKSENHFVEAKATGELFYLFDRPVNVAVGSIFSKEKYSNILDPESDPNSPANGGRSNVIGHAGSAGGGTRRIISGYSELAFNPVDSFEIQLAGRFDDYDDFGSTINPKIGLRWQVIPQLMLRASAGTGFKAPTLVELYQEGSIGNPTFKDEVYCNSTGNCNARQYEVKQGGNKDLKEEKSKSYNIGAVYQAARQTSFSFDLWKVELEDVVSSPSLNKATQYELDHGLGSSAPFGVTIIRDSSDQIVSITSKDQNIGTRDVTGLDMSFSHVENTSVGDFSIRIDHSILLQYKTNEFPGTPAVSILGKNGSPRWKNNTTLVYTPSFHRQSSLHLIAKTIGQNDLEDEDDPEVLKRYTEWDLQYSLRLPWNASATFGIMNIFNQIPPLDESNPGTRLNASLYNPTGQSFYLQYVQSF